MSETSDCCKEFEQEQKLTWSLRRIGNQHRLVLMRIQAKHADVVQQRFTVVNRIVADHQHTVQRVVARDVIVALKQRECLIRSRQTDST